MKPEYQCSCGYQAGYYGFRWAEVTIEIKPGRKAEKRRLVCPKCDGVDVTYTPEV